MTRSISIKVAIAALLVLLASPAAAQRKASKGLTAQEAEARAAVRELQPKIDGALDRSVQWLLGRQLRDGSWSHHQDAYPNGQTSLSVYALLKAGVSVRHAAIQRALDYLERQESRKTYGTACQMMALEATRDPAHKPKIRALLRRLLDWQERFDGAWGYPGNRADLSNTQYAALGLRAAMLAGIKVPKEALSHLTKATLRFQENQRRVDLPPLPEEKREGYANGDGKKSVQGYVAGFKYVPGDQRKPSGSMTAAGVGTLLIVRDCYGKRVPRHVRRTIDRYCKIGINWLRLNWSVEGNPGGGGHNYYYLYGLERVGSLQMEEILAGHPWYLEGARSLIKKQNAEGSWGNESDTCFAILFLKRATWVARRATGQAVSLSGSSVYSGEAKDCPVRIKGSGNPDLVVWLDGFGDKIIDRYAAKGLRVAKVEYLVNNAVTSTIDGNPAAIWDRESYAAKIPFARRGKYEVKARVSVVDKDEAGEVEGHAGEVLVSPAFVVHVVNPKDPWSSEVAEAASKNLLRKVKVKAVASTFKEPKVAGGKAVDGRAATSWLCQPMDPTPRLSIEPEKPVQGRYVTVNPASNFLGGNAASPIQEVRLFLNTRRKPYVMSPKDGFAPVTFDLGKPRQVVRLNIELVRANPGENVVGLTDVYLWR